MKKKEILARVGSMEQLASLRPVTFEAGQARGLLVCRKPGTPAHHHDGMG